MDYEQIKYETKDGILTITLNRPDKLNAFTGRMLSELLDAMDRADRDDDVRAVVFTGAGRGFCAGADLSGGANTFDAQNRGPVDPGLDGHRDGGGLFTLRLFDLLKPTIAACNGPAGGVGGTIQPPEHWPAGWCARCTPPMRSCRRPMRWRARSPTTPRRYRWRSTAR